MGPRTRGSGRGKNTQQPRASAKKGSLAEAFEEAAQQEMMKPAAANVSESPTGFSWIVNFVDSASHWQKRKEPPAEDPKVAFSATPSHCINHKNLHVLCRRGSQAKTQRGTKKQNRILQLKVKTSFRSRTCMTKEDLRNLRTKCQR